ncbi:secretion protein HlyD [Kordiimonas sediminis]|uniref:Secretion protein HlyD n=1 Tax=Kordiimonas sediminis TaxID=1735581 RepID=A0A919ARF3_9PROT|nr:HlyD family efflux transporter periplasmic adaptor subunit [Kordiimonas sediminis]GHF20930.1 secretion protein HlyD [Kordiimonas sediminis]
MTKIKARTIVFGGMALLVAGFFIFAFIPKPLPVDMGSVDRGDLTVHTSDDGRTQVRELYVVYAPVAGRLLRIQGEEGDPVIAGETVIATMRPSGPGFLDERRSKEAEAAVAAAEAALALAQSDVKRAQAEVDFAKAEIKRTRELVANKVSSPAMLDRAELGLRTSEAQLDTAQSAVRVRRADLEVARAALIAPGNEDGTGPGLIEIKSPISGRIMKLVHESEGVVLAGTPLLELGDPAELEIIADFLSHEAVKVKKGARVEIDGWGGAPLEGFVRLVEPKGFTKVSALGIEEQRVNIIIDFAPGVLAAHPEIGHGFRVEPRIVISEGKDVLRIPTSALFMDNRVWSVFQVIGGVATITPVEIGRMNTDHAEVISGLSEGDLVILYPSDSVHEGIKVESRKKFFRV